MYGLSNGISMTVSEREVSLLLFETSLMLIAQEM